MAIIKEYLKTRSDGVKLYRSYSDTEGMALKQVETGIIYSEAVDVENAPYTYEEVASSAVTEDP